MVFKQFTMGWGIETRDLGSRIGYIIFKETDQLVEDLNLD